MFKDFFMYLFPRLDGFFNFHGLYVNNDYRRVGEIFDHNSPGDNRYIQPAERGPQDKREGQEHEIDVAQPGVGFDGENVAAFF